MSAIGKLALVCALASAAAAGQDVPAVVRNTPHFYGAVGRGVACEWAVDADPVSPAGFTLTLNVTGATNPADVRRPNLRDIAKFTDRFVMLDDPPATRPGPPFAYKLRPRTADVAEIPSLEFRYYSPNAAPGKELPTTYAKKLAIRVQPAPPPPAEPLAAPELLFAVAADGSTSSPGTWAWAGLVAGLIFAPATVVLVWRRRNPDGGRVARTRSSRAARRALAALAAAEKSHDPAAAAVAVRGYVADRFPQGIIGPAAATHAEFERELAAVRFAPGGRVLAAAVSAARRFVAETGGES